jgi:hypothetical protein
MPKQQAPNGFAAEQIQRNPNKVAALRNPLRLYDPPNSGGGAGLSEELVGRHLSGDYGGCVHFAVAVGGDTGIIFVAVLVEAPGTVVFDPNNTKTSAHWPLSMT